MEINADQFKQPPCPIHGALDLLHTPVHHIQAYFNIYEYDIVGIVCRDCGEGLRPWWTWLQ